MSDPQPQYESAPLTITWEPTRACDLACLPCRAAVQPKRSRFELSTYESYKLVDQIAKLRPRRFFISGGDPLKRDDLYHLVDYARRRGLPPIVTTTATPSLTEENVTRLKNSGADAIALSLDGSTATTHDSFRGLPGSFEQTMRIARHARAIELPLEINTLVEQRSLPDIDAIVAILSTLDIRTWRLFFLVPMGLVGKENMISAVEAEDLFGALYEMSLIAPFEIETSEATHYRRFVLQRKLHDAGISINQVLDHDGLVDPATINKLLGTTDLAHGQATDTLFVSHTGEVTISRFLPLAGGNMHYESLADVWRDSALFRGLRNREVFEGKCGRCEFQRLCSGSRARAYAVYRDPFESDPLCAYHPG